MAGSELAQLKSLKDALKNWERRFSATHDGKKPSREDIKADPAIAAEYKLYNSLAKRTASAKPSIDHATPSKQRKSAYLPQATPQRRQAVSDSRTPQQCQAQRGEEPAQDTDEDDSPSNQPAFNIIGPTPNKDGRVMGLFDNVTSATPGSRKRNALAEMDCNIAQTPSRKVQALIPTSVSPYKPSRTPQSSGKRFMLDAFVATPSKRLCLDAETPSSSRELRTPSLIRRRTDDMAPLALEASPMKIQPFARRTFGRSLSSMIRDMKQQQEKDMDEELDLLHEIEAADAVNSTSAPTIVKPIENVTEAQFDAFEEEAMAALEDLERQEQSAADERHAEKSDPPRQVWKKKGLKRQTKRVVMRPVIRKSNSSRPHDGLQEANVDDSHSSSDEEEPYVDQTWSEKNKDVQTQSECHAASGTSKPKEKAGKKAGTINPNATAHANFRSLKIKNRNSKAKGRGRFGRGR